MPLVKPFKAFHYNTKILNDLSQVAIPPYDVIKESDATRYLKKSPYNFAHILLPHSNQEDYTKAAKTIEEWFKANIFVEDSTPAFYLYQQTYEWEGVKHRRNSLMCTVAITEYSDKQIFPHENTYGQFKEDRLQILRKTQSNLSHVFGMVKDQEGFLQTLYEGVSFQAPLLKAVTDDQMEQTVWKIADTHTAEIESFFKDKALYILDGHHRFESSRLYAKEKGVLGNNQNPSAFMLFAVVNSLDPALLVLPTHRAFSKIPNGSFKLEALEPYFSVEECSAQDALQFTKSNIQNAEFCLYWQGTYYMLTPKLNSHEKFSAQGALKNIAVVWSDELLIQDFFEVPKDQKTKWIAYEKDAEALIKDSAKYQAVIYHAPTPVEQVIQVANEGGFLPQKSTFFYPKLTAGLVMRKLNGG